MAVQRKLGRTAESAGRETSRPGEQASLQFAHAAKITGFRSSGLSAYNNVDPHTVVRELVQNALDAATAAKRDVVRVVVEIGEIDADEIPARAQYREHLKCAVETQRKKRNLTQSQAIVDAMEAAIDAERVSVLWVLDNGIGLDAGGMEDLLGDGQSSKADESTAGSYGNGHMTSFPASDLRYVVYGGVHVAGRTVSGHAILASHLYRDKVCGEDGYLAKMVRADELFDRFDFYDGSGIPLLNRKLDQIERKFGTGSAVGILGFNRFNRCRNDEEVLEVVETVIATHFMPVIRDGSMEIELQAGPGPAKKIDGAALKPTLERRRLRERRERSSIGPTGRQTWETLETLKDEYGHIIETTAGKVRFHLRLLSSGGGTHVQLFRNGMWITNDVPYNRASDYRNVMPFSGVILLVPDEAPKACSLVDKFEGPRHVDIDLKRQKRGSSTRKALEAFLKEVHEQVLLLVPEIDAKEFDPDFFSIEVTGDGVRRNPYIKSGGAGTPERVPRREPGRSDSGRPGVPKQKSRLRREGRRVEARVTAVRRERGIHLRAKPLEDAVNVELRVVLASGTDETCDNPAPDQYLELAKGATVGGRPVQGYIADEQGKKRAVLLGPVSSAADELDIWLPSRAAQFGDIRVELVRRAAERAIA